MSVPWGRPAGVRMTVTPKETKDAHKIARPAATEFQNKQLTLFQNFSCTQTKSAQCSHSTSDVEEGICLLGVLRYL